MTRLFIFDFFTTIGLSSKLKTLLQGGKPLVILLITAVSYLFIQNLTGVAIAVLMKLDLSIGLLFGFSGFEWWSWNRDRWLEGERAIIMGILKRTEDKLRQTKYNNSKTY
jgi:hypothetical protein